MSALPTDSKYAYGNKLLPDKTINGHAIRRVSEITDYHTNKIYSTKQDYTRNYSFLRFSYPSEWYIRKHTLVHHLEHSRTRTRESQNAFQDIVLEDEPESYTHQRGEIRRKAEKFHA